MQWCVLPTRRCPNTRDIGKIVDELQPAASPTDLDISRLLYLTVSGTTKEKVLCIHFHSLITGVGR